MQGISLVIPTCNRPGVLRNLLQSISEAKAANPKLIREIIIVSDGSKAASHPAYIKLSQEFQAQYFWFAQSRGPSFARNYGVSQSSGEWVWFCDDDLVCDPLAFVTLCQYNPAPDLVLIEGVTEVEKTSGLRDRVAARSDYIGGFGAGNLLIRRDVFTKIGGFDQNYFRRKGRLHFREDTDLGLRMGLEGQTVLLKDLLAFHPSEKEPDSWFVLRDARKYWFDAYFKQKNPQASVMIGTPFQKGRLGTYQLRGFVSDLILLHLLLSPLIFSPLILVVQYVFLAALILRNLRLGFTDFLNAFVIVLLYPLAHSGFYWRGFFHLARRERNLYQF